LFRAQQPGQDSRSTGGDPVPGEGIERKILEILYLVECSRENQTGTTFKPCGSRDGKLASGLGGLIRPG